jgi:hypothetical protein
MGRVGAPGPGDESPGYSNFRPFGARRGACSRVSCCDAHKTAMGWPRAHLERWRGYPPTFPGLTPWATGRPPYRANVESLAGTCATLSVASPVFCPEGASRFPRFIVLENQGNATLHYCAVLKNQCNITLYYFVVPGNRRNVTLSDIDVWRNLCNVTLPWCNGRFPAGSVTLPRFFVLEHQGNETLHSFNGRGNQYNVTLHHFLGLKNQYNDSLHPFTHRENQGNVTLSWINKPWHHLAGPVNYFPEETAPCKTTGRARPRTA